MTTHDVRVVVLEVAHDERLDTTTVLSGSSDSEVFSKTVLGVGDY
jgi:hypothetical protein